MRSIAKDHMLFVQDGEPTGLHAVISGEMHIIGTNAGGNEAIMAIMRPGDWTGFLACLDGGPHAYSGLAIEPATVFSLRPAAVRAIFERDVATFRLLLAPELVVTRKVERFVVEDMALPLARRLAARLIDLGRWAHGPSGGPIVALDHVSQEQLAMSVHASRQKVNEILGDFSTRDFVEIGYGRVRFVDVAALEHFAKFG
jgi:CRP/FNR family transcriptional regulator